MKNRIVLVPFPFDDLSSSKVRPAVCLTDEIAPHGHVVVAFITSNVESEAGTDLTIKSSDPDFPATGLKVSSTIRLHRLITISKALFRRQLGVISPDREKQIGDKLRALFQI